MQVALESDIRIKGRREKEVFVMNFFCSRITQSVSFVWLLWGIDTVRRRHGWTEVDMSGDRWKVVESVLFSCILLSLPFI